MSTTVAQKISSYIVTAPLGKGGMGEVWRARDTRLDRDVALKLLPEQVAHDPERSLRFEREAKLLASLNHPNIGAIYGFEEFEGKKFLVLEFVDGETLAQRLKRGPLDIDDALDVARQIALALEAAHERGIIHRDLKPGNVMVRPDGTIKVLDFGLARALSSDASTIGVSHDSPTRIANSPTLTLQYTQPGMILGTAAYMSPEQARGKTLDKGTDIWSFGIILYECLTSLQPFSGETATDSLGAIMHRDPDWDALPPHTPAGVRTLMRRCLAKERRNRLHDIADVRIEVEQALSDLSKPNTSQSSALPIRPRATRTIHRIALTAGALALIATGYFAGRTLSVTPPSRTAPLEGATFLRATDQSGVESSPCLAPDGGTFVYCAGPPGHRDIYSLRIGGFNPINLTESAAEDDFQPAYSPDGQQIAFRSERQGGGIFIMGATGESPRRLTDKGFNPAWSPDSKSIVFATEGVESPYARNTSSALWVVAVDSGETRKLFDGDAVQPSWSPDGGRIAYWALSKGGQRDLFTIPAAGGAAIAVTNDRPTDWNPVWSPDGRYLYFSSDRGGSMALWRVGVDQRSGAPRAAPEPLTAGVAASNSQVSVSKDGRRLAFTARTATRFIQKLAFDPRQMTVSSQPQTVIRFSTVMCTPAISPDGRFIACCSVGDQEDIFIVNTDGSNRRQVTTDHRKNRRPQWSPDGTRLAFYSDRSGTYEIWLVRPDGGGLEQLTGAADAKSYDSPVWSPDGKHIAAYAREDRVVRIFDVADANRASTSRDLPRPADFTDGFTPNSWSADGKLLAGYVEGHEHMTRIGVVSVDSAEYTILTDGAHPVFCRDSRTLLFTRHQGVFACDIETKAVTPLFTAASDSLDGVTLSPDGREIYFDRATQESDIWVMDLK